jgi:hypothetical protein
VCQSLNELFCLKVIYIISSIDNVGTPWRIEAMMLSIVFFHLRRVWRSQDLKSVNQRTDNTMANRRRTDNTMANRKRTNNTMANRKRTDNTMANRKRTNNTMANRKRTENDIQNTTQKLKIKQPQPHKNRFYCELRCSGRVGKFCSTSGIFLQTNHIQHYRV